MATAVAITEIGLDGFETKFFQSQIIRQIEYDEAEHKRHLEL